MNLDFSLPVSVRGWRAIDDAVMGGVSASRLRHDPAGHAVFEGVVSLENGGGFASVRCEPGSFGAAGIGGYVLAVRGDGKRYKLNLRTDDAIDGINYQQAFTAPAGEWTEICLPCAGFRPVFRGRDVPGAPAFDPARTRQIGLVIADRQAGPFALAIRFIRGEDSA
jgi:hypothetical protein